MNTCPCARIREIPHRAIKFRRFAAQDDLRGLEDAFAEDGSFILHGPAAPIIVSLLLNDKQPDSKSTIGK